MDFSDGLWDWDWDTSLGRQLSAHKHGKVSFDGKARLARHKQGAWIAFLVIFIGLAIFDMKYLAPMAKKSEDGQTMSARVAGWHVAFWFSVGIVFNLGIWAFLGLDIAVVWFNGYLLEYLLSMDNVFFFHVVFTAYATPPKDLYKGLFLGILGAVVLRLLFYIVGAHFFRAAFIVQFGFGLILIWSGYKTAVSDDDDDDPRENKCVQLMTKYLPLTGGYDPKGTLFVKVPKNAPPGPSAEVVGSADAGGTGDPESPPAATGASDHPGDMVWKGTMLLLVVLVLQVIDLIFAVDSVTAKIAEYDSIYVNFTSSAFAMLCLRAMYFVFTKLLKYFHYLKYGVAAILVMIGLKLMVSPWVEIPSEGSLIIICLFFAVSILMSALMPPAESYNEMDEDKNDEKKDASADKTPSGVRLPDDEEEVFEGDSPKARQDDDRC